MTKVKILWADDEIDLLKPQLFFLEKKGYEVVTVTNGHDALEILESDTSINCVFLDESMPGLTGLETLESLRKFNKVVPVVMITKNEAEDLMEEAIGAEINDYLIKPVNPKQILLSLKKIIDNKRIVSEKAASDYQQEFRQISMDINSGLNREEWIELYKKLIQWELKLDESNNADLKEILLEQKKQANQEYSRFVEKNYQSWVDNQDITMSNNLLKKKLFPQLKDGKKHVVILFDNLRLDQWKMLQPIIMEKFRIKDESIFQSILPTATQYSRNSIFAGQMPNNILSSTPEYWLNDNEKGGKNQFEKELLSKNIKRSLSKDIKWNYVKITNQRDSKTLLENIHNYLNNDLTVIVYNFIDMLSHARTEMEVLKELAPDETAYRFLTRSWFINSNIWECMKRMAEKDIQVHITTDHGTIRVHQPSKVIADRETTTNLRYKVGKNLRYQKSDVLEVRDPKKIGLPSPNVSSTFIFAKGDKFFLYPNSYNYYNNLYRDTFQHGGISMEEIICPWVDLVKR